MKLKKLIASALLGSMIITSIPGVTFAEEITLQNETITAPRLAYISAAETDLKINGTTAIVDCWVKGHANDATKAKVIAELQVQSSATNWIPVAIWTDTQDGYRASVYETKTINSANTYRVKATYTVWEGSQSETITVYSD